MNPTEQVARVDVDRRLAGGAHRRLHDDINELLAALNRGVSAHLLRNAHVDHAKAADIAAQLGALFLHHAFEHGEVELGPDPVDEEPGDLDAREPRALKAR
jgi:hypothetical protein